MPTAQDSEEQVDTSQESYELVTPQDTQARRNTSTTQPGDTQEETFAETPTRLRQRLERLQRIRQGLEDTGSLIDPTPGARRELAFEEEKEALQESEESESVSSEGQTSSSENSEEDNAMVDDTAIQGVPTVSKDAAAMFKTADPRDKDLYKEGGCQFPCSERGTTHKEIQKVKKKAKAALTLAHLLTSSQESTERMRVILPQGPTKRLMPSSIWNFAFPISSAACRSTTRRGID